MTTKQRFDSAEFEREYHCSAPLGADVDGACTRFALWAPTAQQVTLNLYHTGHEGEAHARIPMLRAAQGRWLHEEPCCMDGMYYDYDVTVDGVTRRIGDPYARACGLNGSRSMVIDLARTNPDGWKQDRAPAKQPEDVIYEIHVRDFSFDPACGADADKRGRFAALTQTGTTLHGDGVHPTGLDYLMRLGVTHVQLMPSYDYGSVDEASDPNDPNAFNWGYDPVNYNIPEGFYSSDPTRGEVRIREMKEAVMALHGAGLRVIMDVVYNHTYHLDSWLFGAAPWYYHRQREDGSASNGSGCGCETASERSMCARYIVDSVLYWAQEYHIDGFRFDLMGVHDTALMDRIQRELDARFGEGEKLVYGEPWTGGTTSERPGTIMCMKDNIHRLNPAIGAFCDNTRDAVKGGLQDVMERGFANGGGIDAAKLCRCIGGWSGEGMPFAAPSQTITYLSAHDDWTLWDKLIYTLDEKQDFAGSKEDILRVNRLAAAMLFCCQGHLFLLSGEEFARTKQGIKNTYASPLTVNQLDWVRAWENQSLVDYYRGLIALRKQLPGLCDKSAHAGGRILMAAQHGASAASVLLDNSGEGSAYGTLLLAFNAGDEALKLTLPQGEWDVLCDGESSFLWQAPKTAAGETEILPVSALILGKR